MNVAKLLKKESVKKLKKYNHTEAFCLMMYHCESCGKYETLWNSRDGVTPFIIGCAECGGQMQHIRMAFDRQVTDHILNKGDRVFIDMPESLKEPFARKSLNAYKDSEHYDKHMSKSDEEQVKEIVDNMNEGEPFIVTIQY